MLLWLLNLRWFLSIRISICRTSQIYYHLNLLLSSFYSSQEQMQIYLGGNKHSKNEMMGTVPLTFIPGKGKRTRTTQCQFKLESEHRRLGRRGRKKLTSSPRRGGGVEAEPLPAAAEVPEQLLREVGAEIGHLGHLSAEEEEGSRLRCRPLLHCTMNLSPRGQARRRLVS